MQCYKTTKYQATSWRSVSVSFFTKMLIKAENHRKSFSISSRISGKNDRISQSRLKARDWVGKFSFSSQCTRLKIGSSPSHLETRDPIMPILDLVSKVEIGISQGTDCRIIFSHYTGIAQIRLSPPPHPNPGILSDLAHTSAWMRLATYFRQKCVNHV